MSLGKKDIVKNISTKAQISSHLSNNILNSFIKNIIDTSKIQPVKISGFGTFYYHISPKRIGRNPLTKEEFVIRERSKLCLKVSNTVKKSLNW